jgi:hypothetical protein
MVPELTRNADIQLNKLVSLNRIVLLGHSRGRICHRGLPRAFHLALQLRFWEMSESMGNHDSEVVDASSVD